MLSNAASFARDVLDAHTWASWEYEEKRKFVMGFIEGQRVTSEAIVPLVEKIENLDLKEKIQNELESISFNSFAVAVVDEVEAFYMRSKNRRVRMGDACASVIREM